MNLVKVAKRCTVFMSIALVLLVLAGCASTDSSSTSSTPMKIGETKKEFAKKELNIAIFEGALGKDYWLAVKQRFEADYPGVEIHITSNPKIMDIIKPQIMAGNPPDLISIEPTEATGMIQAMMKDKQLLDLTDIFEENALDTNTPLKNKLLDGMLDYSKPLGDGKIYFAPFYISSEGLIYNKTLFEKKGWKVPHTWEEFMALGEIAKQDGRSLFTYQGIYPAYNESIFWSSLASAGGIAAVTKAENYEQGAFKSDAMTKVMDVYDTIAQKDYLMPGTVALNHTKSQNAFLQGKALFIPCGTWIEYEMRDAPREEGFQYGFAAPPVFKEGDQQYAQVWLNDMYIPAKAKNIELAKEFLRYQYKDDIVKLNAEKSRGIIAIKNGVEIAKPYILPVFYDSMKIFDNDVKPIMFQWKTTPKSPIVIANELWYPIGSIMNKTMTVAQWQDHVESASGTLRELISKSGK